MLLVADRKTLFPLRASTYKRSWSAHARTPKKPPDCSGGKFTHPQKSDEGVFLHFGLGNGALERLDSGPVLAVNVRHNSVTD
jgi:hypothetical protein